MPPPTDLITAKRASAILCCHLGTVHRYRRQGKLRGWRRGAGHWLFSEDEVRALLEPARTNQASPLPSRARLDREHAESLERLRRKGMRV